MEWAALAVTPGRTSPTKRSLDYLRANGYIACVVEKWIPKANRRQDAFGFGDILAASPVQGVVLVQATTASNLSARRTKIVDSEDARRWCAAGARILIHAWHRPTAKRPYWDLTEEWVAVN